MANADRLWNQLLQHKADRKTVVVAVGGGVVGDLAGFIAATYARGLPFVQVPTTLLAHVDSSVGGKVGVNLPNAKNMVGAFWQPLGVLIDTAVLETLPDREYRAGLAEVVKYGVILDAEFFTVSGRACRRIERPESGGAALRRRPVLPAEGGRGRAGRTRDDRTAGRAELRSHVRARHRSGSRVRRVPARRSGFDRHVGRLATGGTPGPRGRDCSPRGRTNLLQRLGLPTALPDLDPAVLLAAMRLDKKVAHGRLRFVLPTRMGHVELVGDVPEAEVVAVLRRE